MSSEYLEEESSELEAVTSSEEDLDLEYGPELETVVTPAETGCGDDDDDDDDDGGGGGDDDDDDDCG